ncbi:MerR family transcriptional regulator [Gorillibacterium sp. sgz500922]|uniref:MerR family transcriptional regulator n=1 Tax=Gorillibacterium sp. sgz500922 TaxID=3446694 RepID=UPI003F67C02F
MTDYLRGQLAEQAGVNLETLRYYEGCGLLPSPRRSEAGYRLYSEEALTRLIFIRNAKSSGFTLKEIKKALVKAEGNEGIAPDAFSEVIDRKRAEIDGQIQELERRKRVLDYLQNQIRRKEPDPDIAGVLRELRIN